MGEFEILQDCGVIPMEHEVVKWCVDNWALTLFAGVTLIQIAPIRIDPWSWLFRQLKGAIGITGIAEDLKKTNDQLKSVRVEMANVNARIDERDAVSCRTRILRFNDELLLNVKHSRNMFDMIIRDCSSYEAYCREHPSFENGVTHSATENIHDAYETCMHEHTFL